LIAGLAELPIAQIDWPQFAQAPVTPGKKSWLKCAVPLLRQ